MLSDFREFDRDQHRHVIAWEETTEPEGFAHLNEQLEDLEPWQFQVRAQTNWRVHGFLLGNVFHIVWLDPGHKLYR